MGLELMKEIYQEEKELNANYKVIVALQNIQELDSIEIPDVDKNGVRYSLDKEIGTILIHSNFHF